MKKQILNLGKALDKKEQKNILAGRGPGGGPCGGTGGDIVSPSRCIIGEYGTQWFNGRCYACH